MKIAVIGGGSTYTPELLGGLVERAAELDLTELVLHDVRADRLVPVGGFCRRMAAARGAAFTLRETYDLVDAVSGAGFVIVQIRVGGQEARHEDILMGLRHGLIGQETTGVGGMAKALRTIPEVLKLARVVKEHAPDAWIVNFTNPSGIVTEALLRFGGVRTVGLCNIPMETRMELAAALHVPPETVDLDYVGLNHLAWVRRVLVGGVDHLPAVLEVLASGHGPKNIPEMEYDPEFLRALGALPSPYLRYFYATDTMLAELRANPLTRAQEVMAIEAELLAYYADPANVEPPPGLSKRGGAWYSRAAVELMGALLQQEPALHVVNVTNAGALPGLPDDAVVEVPAWVSRAGVTPRPVGDVRPELLGLVQQVKAYERLTIEAAVTGRKDRALLALVANPLVPGVQVARDVLRALELRGLPVPVA